jgi:hypothetical protein
LGDDGGTAFVGVAGKPAHHLGVDDTGADGVDSDVRGGVVQRGRLGEADEAVLGGGVGGLAFEPPNASAVARPMPLVAPVTKATLLSKRPLTGSP